MIKREYLLLFLSLHFIIETAFGNIDLSNPILISDGYSESFLDSNFGYTVSLLNGNSVGSSKGGNSGSPSWVFVGAPRGNYIQRQEVNHPPIKEPGVIWRCSLGSSNEVCETVNLQNPFSQAQPACHQKNYYQQQCRWVENQNGSWFGASMSISKSQSSREREESSGLVGCGYRWKKKNIFHMTKGDADMMNGICYWLPKSSISSQLGNTQPIRLDPLKDESQGYYRFNEKGRLTNDYEYYYGEAGFSSHLTDRNQIILGSPGVHSWSGSLIYYEHPRANPTILRPESHQIKKYDLLGYSVTSGRLYEHADIIFVAGSPTANELHGRVILFQKDDRYGSLVVIAILEGKQLGSYFGFTVCAIDVDNDQVDELLVGAPFYGSPENAIGDQGCVEMYSFKQTGTGTQSICSTQAGGRFGSAIAYLGDINNDGFNDFAIGAPYEKQGGAVYIYHGVKGKITFTDAKQIIRAADIVSGLSNWKPFGFGSSIHGGVDIDGNETPDLVIGNYFSKSAVVYRTRPTLRLYTDISFEILGRKATKFNRIDNEFVAKYCIDFWIVPTPKFAAQIKLWNHVTVDKDHKRFTILKDNSNKRKQEINSEFTTTFAIEVAERTCINLRIQRTKDFEQDIPKSKLEINVEALVWYNYTENVPFNLVTYDIKKAPNNRPQVIVNDGGRNFEKFCTHCPAWTKSDLKRESLSIAQDDCNADGQAECDSKLKFKITLLDAEKQVILPGQRDQYPFDVGSSKRIVLKTEIRNEGETAYSPIVDMKGQFTEDEIFPVKKNCEIIKDRTDSRTSILRCKIGHPIHKTVGGKNQVTLYMEIDVSSLYAKEVSRLFVIEVSVYPLDKKVVSKTISIDLRAQAKVLLTGSINTRQLSITNTSYISIAHRYTASLRGKSSVPVRMKFLLPVNFTQNGETRTLIFVPKPTGIMCSTNVGSFNELVLQKDSTVWENSSNGTNEIPSTRKKRDTSPSLTDKGTLAVHCDKPWECMEIICETRIASEGSVNVEFLMHIDTKVARSLKKLEHKQIVVKSQGYAGILTEDKSDYKRDASSYTTVTIVAVQDFPIWIAIVSGIGGLLLLILITLGLAKCGFFKRQTKEDLKALKAKSEGDALLGNTFPMQQVDYDED